MNSSALSVLFVDDEPYILDGLRRQLREHRSRWTMRFASDATEALSLLEKEAVDVIVADLRMPGMSGGDLLREVHRLYPQTTRIIFSGHTDHTALCRNIGSVHHYLHKPCEPGVLCQAIERTNHLRQRLTSPGLRLAVNRIAALPPGGENYRALLNELAKEPADISRIAHYVERDPALTAKVIQLVSSAFFGLPRRVSDPRDAVVLLGINAIQAIVVAGQVFDTFDKASRHRHQIARLWTSSILTGDLAARYARDAHASRETQQIARLSGVLSLVGRAILLNSEPASYADVWKLARSSHISLVSAEQRIFGATYTEIGSYALGLWGLSEPVVNAVASQCAPSTQPQSETNNAAIFVHLARWTLGGPERTLDEKPPFDASLAERPLVRSLIDLRRQSA